MKAKHTQTIAWVVVSSVLGATACNVHVTDYVDDTDPLSRADAETASAGPDAGTSATQSLPVVNPPDAAHSALAPILDAGLHGEPAPDAAPISHLAPDAAPNGHPSPDAAHSEPAPLLDAAAPADAGAAADYWPELPAERGTVSGIEPFVFEDTNCTPEDFPVGSGKRWVQTVPGTDANNQEYNTVAFLEARPSNSHAPVGVFARIGTVVALWETELLAPEGLAASPVYWVGAVGGPPVDQGMAVGIYPTSPGTLDGEKVRFYFSEDGSVFEPLPSSGVVPVIPGSGFVFVGSEAGGWSSCFETPSEDGGASE